MAVVAAENPTDVFAIIEQAEGFAVVRSEDPRTENAFHVAASVAVIKASWGWDEAKPIVIRVDEKELKIYPSFDGRAWIASDHP
jgi:hypothetical protein